MRWLEQLSHEIQVGYLYLFAHQVNSATTANKKLASSTKSVPRHLKMCADIEQWKLFEINQLQAVWSFLVEQ